MKVLVVEDERTAAAFLRQGLREEGYAVDLVERADAADEAIAVYEYDAVLLDVMIPGGDGFDLCRRWRERGIRTPILFLTARDDIRDRVRGLDEGGDDYLTKPYSFEELLARLRAILRRGSRAGGRSSVVVGDLRIDLVSHHVFLDEREIALTQREYQIIEYLALHADRPVTRVELLEHVWETGAEPDSNVVDVYIGYLRSKLGRHRDYIRTMRGSGYVLGVPRGAGEASA